MKEPDAKRKPLHETLRDDTFKVILHFSEGDVEGVFVVEDELGFRELQRMLRETEEWLQGDALIACSPTTYHESPTRVRDLRGSLTKTEDLTTAQVARLRELNERKTDETVHQTEETGEESRQEPTEAEEEYQRRKDERYRRAYSGEEETGEEYSPEDGNRFLESDTPGEPPDNFGEGEVH